MEKLTSESVAEDLSKLSLPSTTDQVDSNSDPLSSTEQEESKIIPSSPQEEESKIAPTGFCDQLQIQYILVDSVSTCRQICEQIKQGQIAVDIEGVRLCRTGKICIIQIQVENDPVVKLFDITVLQQSAFDEGGLRRVLESPEVVKVMYDPRADADALYHLYGTRVRNVVDVQVLYCRSQDISRRDNYLKGLKVATEDYARRKSWDYAYKNQVNLIKQQGRKLFAPEIGGSFDVFSNRPMTGALIEYLCADVIHLIGMAELWNTYKGQDFEALVERRIEGAIKYSMPATGRYMAKRDFR